MLTVCKCLLIEFKEFTKGSYPEDYPEHAVISVSITISKGDLTLPFFPASFLVP